MIGVKINNGFLDFAKIDFKCPNCKKKYVDINDKYLKKCEKNKSGVAGVKCKCGQRFFMTYDYQGNAVSFI